MSLSQRDEELNDARQEGIDTVLQAFEELVRDTQSDGDLAVLSAALKELQQVYQ